MLVGSLLAVGLLLGPGIAWAGPGEGKASISTSGAAEASATSSKGEREPSSDVAQERKKPWILRWGPENNELDLGLYLGAFVLGDNHGLFDRGMGTQPDVKRGAFDFGFRATYFPLKYIGVGLGTSVMATRSPELDARANFFTVRGHVVGQGPWRISPTLTLGGGLLGVNSPNPRLRASDGAFHWGPGVKFYINKWIMARVDGRHIVTPDGIDRRNAHHGEILFGVEVTLRFKRIVKTRRDDADGDGIEDDYDDCPREAGVEPHGCPEHRDTDNDGIPDDSDRCPRQWGDTPSGCPIPDTDNDGILDSSDDCIDEPETYNGFSDADGCPDEPPEALEQFTGVIRGIRFASGKATVRRRSYKVLNRAARVLKEYRDVRLEIVGHTDAQGSHDRNMDLSQRRAEAVEEYLVDQGIDADRLYTRGAGPDEPIADNKTRSGRAKNRRIEFKLLPPGATTTATPESDGE